MLAVQLVSCAKKDDSVAAEKAKDEAIAQVASSEPEKLKPLFEDAKKCLFDCITVKTKESEYPSDLYHYLGTSKTAKKNYDKLLLVTVNDEKNKYFQREIFEEKNKDPFLQKGYFIKKILRDGNTFLLYEGINKYTGERGFNNLTVVINDKTKEFAGWVRDENYKYIKFIGSEYLLSILTAYQAILYDEMERAFLISRLESSQEAKLPISSDRADSSLKWINYFNSAILNGEINNAKSFSDAGNEARKEIERPWYTISVSETSCIETNAPAAYITEIQDLGYSPNIKDYGSDSSPNKVEVSYEDLDYSHKRQYWRNKDECELEIPANRPIADKYQ